MTQQKKDTAGRSPGTCAKAQALAARVEELYIQCGKPKAYEVLKKPRNEYTIKHLQHQVEELEKMAAEKPTEKPTPEPTTEPTPEPTPEPDYKLLYLEARAEIERLEQQIMNLTV